jgi:DNA modification methylase
MDPMDRVNAEILACERGDYGEARLFDYFYGWADWQMEKLMIQKEQYETFLESKKPRSLMAGVSISGCHEKLYDFQSAIVKWACEKGRAAIFADCGLGKTFMQVEWARLMGGRCLIVSPLSVAEQTVNEAKHLGIQVRHIKSLAELGEGIHITNYERIRDFADAQLDSIVLDESSILKSVDGKTRTFLLDSFQHVPYRLCCTATPCPNDISEIANHAEFLGVMKRTEMLASFFVHDDEGWRLRGHAAKPFYRWMATWAMALKNPSDLGFDGARFILPPIDIRDVVIETNAPCGDALFPVALHGIEGRMIARKDSTPDRVEAAAKVAAASKGQVIVWCGLNDEAELCAKAIPDSRNVQGSDDADDKARDIRDFVEGKYRVLITKAKIAGFGLNFQNASTIIFCGMGDSYESYYQCIRRCWRYGQKNPVDVYLIVGEHEIEILENVKAKEKQAELMSAEIIQGAKEFEQMELKHESQSEQMTEAEYTGEGWQLMNGDCVEKSRTIPSNSIDLSVFSPPFLSLYTYSASEKDMGNCSTDAEFYQHLGFLIDELMRITKPGRLVCVHCASVATTLTTHGTIGIKDFRGELVRQFVAHGWVNHGEVCIDKDPQAQAIRTHSKGLLFVQLKKDSSWLRPALADYILVFRKPGENADPIHPDINNEEWIEWARPIWYGISESDTLNTREAKANDDDRHICALQLGTIERCVRLWSNPGDTVFSPFAGIGSEGYVALQHGRKFIGTELKPLYAKVAARNLATAAVKAQPPLFAGVEA